MDVFTNYLRINLFKWNAMSMILGNVKLYQRSLIRIMDLVSKYITYAWWLNRLFTKN